jgi:hypothetical protein
MRSFKIYLLYLSLGMVVLCSFSDGHAQESRVNQRKIEREREKKQKKARKDYEKAVKRHKKMQSKSTRTSMKRTKKESMKVTPTGR